MTSDLAVFFNKCFSEFILSSYGEANPLSKAMIYVCESEGKKLRARFCLEACQLLGGHPLDAVPGAIALELIHAYSLVHDDLPAMDNDDVRRGRPTVHKAFDEATAILVGDALQADAFDCLARYQTKDKTSRLNDSQRLHALAELSLASGSRGMVLGQALDCFYTGKENPTQIQIEEIHLKKTGALFGAALAIGGVLGGGSAEQVDLLRQAGLNFGLAFQILDDLIDDQEATGKSKGKDLEQGKWSFLRVMSKSDAKDFAKSLTEIVQKDLASLRLKQSPSTLEGLIQKLLHRSN